MLYSIIPPILIILSLIGIIVFLMKKSGKVANLSIEEIVREEEERKIMMDNAGFLRKIGLKIKNIKWDDWKHVALAVLEKITRKSRVIFLKLESKFGGWSTDIREKRKARTEKNIMRENSRQENVIQKLKDYKIEKFKKTETEKEEAKEIAAPEIAFVKKAVEEEKVIKPMISEKVAKPRRAEIKDQLEELLIERIAANPRDLEAYERLGQYYMEIKSFPDAKECFKQVIKLDPGNRNARYKLKRLETLL